MNYSVDTFNPLVRITHYLLEVIDPPRHRYNEFSATPQLRHQCTGNRNFPFIHIIRVSVEDLRL